MSSFQALNTWVILKHVLHLFHLNPVFPDQLVYYIFTPYVTSNVHVFDSGFIG